MPQAHGIVMPQPESDPVVNTDSGLRSDDLKQSSIFTQYIKENNYPYTVKYFDISNWEKFGPNIALIESYVADEIEKRGYQDSLASYNEIIGDLLKKMGTSENELPINRILKLSKFIEMKGRNLSREQKIKKLLDRKYERDISKRPSSS